MKPSEIINALSLKSIEANTHLQELKKMPESEEKVQLVALVGYAVQIQSIIDYLDAEWEKKNI